MTLRVVQRNDFLNHVFWEDIARKIDVVDVTLLLRKQQNSQRSCQAYFVPDSRSVVCPCEFVAYTAIG